MNAQPQTIPAPTPLLLRTVLCYGPSPIDGSQTVLRHFKLQAPADLMKLIACEPRRFACRPDEQLTTTGAKMYYRGGGWWFVSGYAFDGADVQRNFKTLHDAALARGMSMGEGVTA